MIWVLLWATISASFAQDTGPAPTDPAAPTDTTDTTDASDTTDETTDTTAEPAPVALSAAALAGELGGFGCTHGSPPSWAPLLAFAAAALRRGARS